MIPIREKNGEGGGGGVNEGIHTLTVDYGQYVYL